MLEKEKISQFWLKQHLALFGLSRDPKKISRQVYDLLVGKGYKIYPINPHVEQINSIKCYKSLNEIKQGLEGAIIVTNPKISLEVAKQCHHQGIHDFWFQLDTMDDDVKAYLNDKGINYICSCVLLHHKEAGFPHSWHRFFYRLFRMK